MHRVSDFFLTHFCRNFFRFLKNFVGPNLTLVSLAGVAFMVTDVAQGQMPSSNELTVRYTHNVLMAIGVNTGGFSLGADYEYQGSNSFGLGGYTRFYQKDSTAPGTSAGYFTFGAFIRPHFYKKGWDLYVSPGFGVVNIDATSGKSETSMGPSLALGLMYQLQNQIAFGVENMKTYSWFNEDYRGLLINDFMIRARMSF